MPKIIQLQGERFNLLTVVSFAGQNKHGSALWNCVCDCGEMTVAESQSLKTSKKKSCGCWRKHQAGAINKSHGKSRENGKVTHTYMQWSRMRSRCNTVGDSAFHRYGAIGIKVCERWDSYESFLADMGEASPSQSIDRKDSTGDYELNNCRWATRQGQAQNRRIPTNNKSGVKNVHSHNGKIVVSIAACGRKYQFGPFDDIELAELVAYEARRRLHGEYANHN